MADEKTDAEITPVSLERMLLKKPEHKYNFTRLNDNEKSRILTDVCTLMREHGLPIERSDESYFFYNAVPGSDPNLRQQYLNQMVKLNSKVYDLAKKHNIDVTSIVRDIVKRADTEFHFHEGFPNSGYLFHAVYMHGMKEEKTQEKTPEQMFGIGLKAVESILDSPEYSAEYLNSIARTQPTVKNIIPMQFNYKGIM